jgi:hypothetical protein
VKDASNDVFSIVVENPASGEDLDDVNVYCFSADIFQTVMRNEAKNNEVTAILIGNAGTITTQLNGHNVVIMPKVDEEGE